MVLTINTTILGDNLGADLRIDLDTAEENGLDAPESAFVLQRLCC